MEPVKAKLRMRLISPLEKVFPDASLPANFYREGSALRGETAAFQLALYSDEQSFISFRVRSDLPVTLREVRLVPSEVPARVVDDFVLREGRPGLYPDLLDELPSGGLHLPAGQWRAVWVSAAVPRDAAPGVHEISITPVGRWVRGEEMIYQLPVEGEADYPGYDGMDARFKLEVIPAELPVQTLKRTEWFHVDCLYMAYHTECWSEKHWEMIARFAANAAGHGINMLYVPLWTPPLDTAVGGERPTVQLLDIELGDDGKYRFDFTRFRRYVAVLREAGITYFEIVHPFTQWGAEFAPKIIVKVNGKDEKRFGWHVAAMSEEYRDFLTQLMPPLLAEMETLGVGDKCYFHISDEPGEQHLEQFAKCAGFMHKLVGDHPFIDALSNFDFYKHGLVPTPIPANNHIEAFRGKVPELWTYYCVGQGCLVPNRFMSMASARNRIMGLLMYQYDIKGFLQWGFNFYYSSHSRLTDIDVFKVTDSDRTFSSGDAFMVYPGKDGPLDSIRHEVFTQGLQDLRAMMLLERKIGREKALAFLRESVGYEMTMTCYPRAAEWLTGFRERLNRALVG